MDQKIEGTAQDAHQRQIGTHTSEGLSSDRPSTQENSSQEGSEVERDESYSDPNNEHESNEAESQDSGHEDLNPIIKKRLGQEQKKHRKEMREIQRQLQEQLDLNKQFNDYIHQQNPNLDQQQEQQPQFVNDPVTGEKFAADSWQGQRILDEKRRTDYMNAMKLKEINQQTQKRLQELGDEMEDAFEEAAERYPDFKEKVFKDDLPITEVMRDMLKLAPDNADLVYYLAQTPKEVQRIANMNPLDQVRTMMKVMVQHAKRNTASKAPEPVKPLSGPPKASSGTSGSFEYFDRKAKERHKK